MCYTTENSLIKIVFTERLSHVKENQIMYNEDILKLGMSTSWNLKFGLGPSKNGLTFFFWPSQVELLLDQKIKARPELSALAEPIFFPFFFNSWKI